MQLENSLTLKALTQAIMDQAKEKGFGVKPDDVNVAEKFALIHSEVSEAFEAYRKNRWEGKDGLPQELGDVLQRVLHLAGILGIDIEAAVKQKMQTNQDRVWDWDAMNEKHS